MRVAALYDIHGNLPALEAVIEDVRRVEPTLIVIGGDVLPGPMAAECLARLAAIEVEVALRYIAGNGERETLAAADGHELTAVPLAFRPPIAWCAQQLAKDQLAALREWPATQDVAVPGLGRVCFCHATPRSDVEIFTRVTPESRLAPACAGVSADVVVCGHTHMAFERRVGELRVMNAGSVGMPFGLPGAHWLLLEPAGPRFMHTPYDLAAAAARIRATEYPGADAFAADHVLRPPTEAAMLAAFER